MYSPRVNPSRHNRVLTPAFTLAPHLPYFQEDVTHEWNRATSCGTIQPQNSATGPHAKVCPARVPRGISEHFYTRHMLCNEFAPQRGDARACPV